MAEKAISNTITSGVDINEAEKYLKNAKNSFDKREFEEAKYFAVQAEKIAIESKITYSASSKIKIAEEVIKNMVTLGASVDEAQEYLGKAKSKFDEGEFKQAAQHADKAEKIAKEIKNKHLNAFSKIKLAEEIIENARRNGADIKESALLLQSAKQALADGNYNNATELATHAKKIAKKIAEMNMMARKVLTATVIAVVIFIVVSVVRILRKK
ncbi:MAG: hypothetical protein CHKLHMKO_00295 [Candidatus Argoarchaeum ethanivorans]|uniref:DUF4398 domain-containing protein n=1 Tax=Candidatus Argoarchaeum ethanivorans TaxID=2608793 RepID=A0A811TAS6_9EURY|nr:MAG: hypothetical protein CHKLHMKO_00295 [Candidatus Argoarchaeum ethanivorans]